MAPDGAIVIDTRIDQSGFNTGLRKIQVAAAGALNKVLLPIVGIGSKVQTVLLGIMGSLKNGLAGLAAGLFVAFALSVSKIFAFLREAVQDAITLNPTVARQWEEIQNSFVELKHAIGNAFLPLIQVAIPYIKMALSWLIEVFNRLAMITAALMGQKEVLQIVQGSAQKIADANKKTEKAAKGQLAAFDQINTLQKPDSGADVEDLPKVAGELVPVTDDILEKVQAIKDEIAAWFADPIGKLQETWGKIVDWFRRNVLDPIVAWWNQTWAGGLLATLWESFKALWQKIFGETSLSIEGLKTLVSGLFQNWIEAINVFASTSLGIFPELFKAWIEAITRFVSTAVGLLPVLFQSWVASIQIFITTALGILPILSEGFSKALDWIKEKFTTVFTAIGNFIRGVIDSIIGYIGNLVNSILAGIAAVTGGIGAGAIGSTVSLTTRPPRAPGLATGAVIPPNAAFAAILGDQRSGRNIEAPEALIRQIVREETANQSRNVNITFEGTLGELVRLLKPKIDQENRRVGGSLAK